MGIMEYVHQGKVIARHITTESHLQADGLTFCSVDDETMQVGIWQYSEGKELLRHRHNEVPRTTYRTHEVLVVLSGVMRAYIYSLDDILLHTLIICPGEVLVLLDCGHGYEILMDDTRVVEIKNGPYPGADIDRVRF